MYSDVFCEVYNVFGWNYYPEIFGQQLLQWLRQEKLAPKTAMDLGCGTGVLCRVLHDSGIQASGMDLSQGMICIAQKENPTLHFEVADMLRFRPIQQFDLVTCTGDALNHIHALSDIAQVFQNVYAYTAPGGVFVFDILNDREVSGSEPFEMDFSDTVRVWFQMTRPDVQQVNLKIRVYENGTLSFEENIRETVHNPAAICDLLRQCGFREIRCTDRLLSENEPGTTWFIIARKPQ